MSTLSDFVYQTYSCFQDVLTAPGVDTPSHIVLRPGIQVEPDMGISGDDCCAGYAYIRIMRKVAPELPTRQAPLGTPISPCGLDSTGVQLELGIFRCAPTGDQFAGPTDDQWNDAFGVMLADEELLWKTLCCVRQAFADADKTWSIIYNQYIPMEVMGGCYGGKMQFTAEVECPDADCS